VAKRSMDDELALACPLCSKAVRKNTGAPWVANVVAHVRCIARQARLRTREIRVRVANTVARAGLLVAQSKVRRAKDSRDSFALAGRITAFDTEARLVTVGVLKLSLAKGVPLVARCVGLSVTVTGHRVGEDLVATDVRVRRPGFP